MIEEHVYEESYQEYPNEVSFIEDIKDTWLSIKKYEVVKPCEDIISSIDIEEIHG
jgi:hypothetical protein